MFMIMALLLGGCLHKSMPPSGASVPIVSKKSSEGKEAKPESKMIQPTEALAKKTPPISPKTDRPVGPDLSRVLEKAPKSFHAAMRADWPPEKWVSAKAYTFNFGKEGRVKLRVFDGEWNQTIRQTIPISKEAAEAALELTHRTSGAVHASKCPLPRHAVVYFNEKGDPVASVNVCFSCSDIMVWPKYGTDALRSKKYADWDTMEEIHSHALSRWQLFFDGVGADSYTEK